MELIDERTGVFTESLIRYCLPDFVSRRLPCNKL